MKKKIIVGLVLAMSVSMLAGCGKTEETADNAVQDTSLESYEGDGWTLQYDPDVIMANAGDDGSVTFSYYSEEYPQAGSDYMMVSRIADIDYETVLAGKQTDYEASDAEITMSNFGTDGAESYSFTKTSEASAESGLQTSISCTAIPVDSDVILIESYITIEPEDEDMMRIDAAFETVAGTFAVTGTEE